MHKSYVYGLYDRNQLIHNNIQRGVHAEKYVSEHSKVSFTHGICPECTDRLYGNGSWYIELKKSNNKKQQTKDSPVNFHTLLDTYSD